MASTLEQMQVPNGTGPGVRRSKHDLLASRIRCKCTMKTLNSVIKSKTVIRSRSITRARFSKMSVQWRVSLNVPECHGRRRIHNV